MRKISEGAKKARTRQPVVGVGQRAQRVSKASQRTRAKSAITRGKARSAVTGRYVKRTGSPVKGTAGSSQKRA